MLAHERYKLKYRRSFLGYVWSILNPLMIMGIMVLVFSNMFRFDIQSYPVYLIVGQTIFNFVSEQQTRRCGRSRESGTIKENIMCQMYIFTLSKVTSSFVNTLFALGAMLLVIYFLQSYFQLEYAFLFRLSLFRYISFHWDWECF